MRQHHEGRKVSAAIEDAGARGDLTTTVLIPSYRRPEKLRSCLDSVLAGTRTPEQIVVVLRDTDDDSHHAARDWRQAEERRDALLDIAEVTEPGPMAAANAGLELATGEIVCFIDDDCVVTESWLERILSHYSDPRIIGVGGRDIVHHGDQIEADPQQIVGRLTWYGRIIGNHHQPGFREPREVDHLKGANMSFRRSVIPVYDLALRSGVYHEIDVALGAASGGGRIIYDPRATVHHYPAPRYYGHARDSETAQAVTDLAHDCAYVMLKHLPAVGRAGFWLFSLAIGQHRRYGLLRMLLLLPRERMLAVKRWRAAMRGLNEVRGTLRRAKKSEGDATNDR